MTDTFTPAAWIDVHGDVWTLGDDGLLHTPETAPFTREHVEKKWGPLAPIPAVLPVGQVALDDCVRESLERKAATMGDRS